MGSGQSAPEQPPSSQIPALSAQDRQDDTRKKKKGPPKDLTGVALAEYKCRKKKKAWSECVGTFYGRFSSGKVLEDEEADCDDLFDKYRACYMKGLLKDREKRGLGAPKEGTVLAEFVEDEGLDQPDTR